MKCPTCGGEMTFSGVLTLVPGQNPDSQQQVELCHQCGTAKIGDCVHVPALVDAAKALRQSRDWVTLKTRGWPGQGYLAPSTQKAMEAIVNALDGREPTP
jgi:hypothetical protein